jgi:hypothetical protein
MFGNPFNQPQQQNIPFNQQSPVFNAFGGFQNFMQQFQGFMNGMKGMNQQQMAEYAQQQIQQNLQSGKISQDDFNNVAAMVNQMLGSNNQRM